MTLSREQRIAIAALLVLGGLGSAALYFSPARSPAAAAAQADGARPPAHGPEDEAGQEHAGADAHEDETLVRLSPEQQRAAGLVVTPLAAGRLRESRDFAGELRFNEDRTAHVVPRLAGVVEEVRVELGQQVRKHQLMAVVASTALAELRSELLGAQRRLELARLTHEREKKLWQDGISAEQDYLQARTAWQEADIAVANAREKLAAVGATPSASGLNRFEIRAPFEGTVVEKHLAPGEAVREDANVFTVSDLRSVWAEFAVAPQDLARVRVGQQVTVSSSAFDSQAEGRIAYLGALLGEQTRSARARVSLSNPQGAWRPGLFVTVRVRGAEQGLALAVPASALQSIEGQPTVFKAVEGGFRAVRVKTGRSDGQSVEILEGLRAGDPIVSDNAYVLKAELGKSSAEHSH